MRDTVPMQFESIRTQPLLPLFHPSLASQTSVGRHGLRLGEGRGAWVDKRPKRQSLPPCRRALEKRAPHRRGRDARPSEQIPHKQTPNHRLRRSRRHSDRGRGFQPVSLLHEAHFTLRRVRDIEFQRKWPVSVDGFLWFEDHTASRLCIADSEVRCILVRIRFRQRVRGGVRWVFRSFSTGD